MVIIKSLVKSDESLLVMPVSYETYHPCLKLTKGLYVSESNLPTFLVLACVFKSAFRGSRLRQQYNNGLMEEFINTKLSARCQAIVHRSGITAKVDMEMKTGE